jgi:hypothetical protein
MKEKILKRNIKKLRSKNSKLEIMKSNIYKYAILTSCFIALLFTNTLFAQEDEVTEFDIKQYKTVFKFNTIKQADNSRLLEVEFLIQNKKDRKDKIPVYEAEIEFYNVTAEDDILIGSALTSQDGIAKFIASPTQNYVFDEEGFINLSARFKGNKTLKSTDDDVAIKDLFLELNLEEIDSVKTVFLKAFTIDSLGTKTALEEADVIFAVKGMLSNMPIHEGYISDGEYEFEFPTDIPGDEHGNLTVIAMIEDSDDFATVFQEKNVTWGVHEFEKITKQKNTLWSEAAPLWMYVVLTILLVGVWANYVYTVVNLFKIKKEGKLLETVTEE